MYLLNIHYGRTKMQLIGETKKCATGAKGWGWVEGAKFAKAKRVGSEFKKKINSVCDWVMD